MMYRIEKVLNHNTVIAIHQDKHKEVLIMGKGVGFGRKVAERIEVRPEDRLYSLQKYKERGGAKEIVKSIAPEFLELTNAVLGEAEKVFGKIDRMVLFPLADHIAFAVKRIQNHEQISNPLTEDIRVLFHMEFKVAESIRPLLKKQFQIDIEDEKVSQAMQMARSVRECISMVEEAIGKPIDIASLSYNRLMNHIRYMVARALSGEKLKVNMNDYMEVKFPESFGMAQVICDQVGTSLGVKLEEVETGYLAMHIERVANDEREIEE